MPTKFNVTRVYCYGILFLFFGLGFVVSLISPLFEPPDEIRHYRYIRKLVVEHQLPVQGEEEVRSQSHHPPLYHLLSALASFWIPSEHTSTYEHPMNPFWGYRNWEVGVDNKLQYWHTSIERFPFRAGFLAAMVPRWVNVLLGMLTVGLTYMVGQRIWPQRPALALASALLVALNPQFIYLSAAMNNDIVAAACGTAVLLMCVVMIQEGLSPRRLVILGLVYGLALLAKLHLATFGALIVVSLALAAQCSVSQNRHFAILFRWLQAMLWVFSIAGLLAGWWFVRNWVLYGDLTGMSKLNELWYGRSAGGSWWAIEQGVPYLWSSLWARFGYGQIPLPSCIYTILLLFCGVGLLGLLWTRRSHMPGRWVFLLGGIILLFTGVVFYYMMIQPAGAMGRFLFPVLPAFAILVVGGWNTWLRCPRYILMLIGAGMSALLVIAVVGYFWPAVRYPARVAGELAQSVTTVVQVGDVARVLAMEVSPARVQPGDPVWVRVVWEPLRVTARPYTVYVHLIDDAGVLAVQRDTWPGLGRAPTTFWREGRVFEDIYRLDLSASVYTPAQAQVYIGMYESEWGRLELSGARTSEWGLNVGEVAIDPAPGAWPNTQFANFTDEIALVGYTLEPRALQGGESCTVTLYWQVLVEPRYDYAIFAQVLDTEYNVWGSHDGGGVIWTPGEVVTVTRQIPLRPETPPGNYPLQVGLFHKEAGRLRVITSDGREVDERVLLGPLRVK
ncbi:MAG: glycosyltransferase family 39 protein [Anaerolineae bacterium]|nr:glycosyltransferase family 39 protein [Anaerolineae bacterium]